ncbi:MAG: hypothetical protein R2711_13520 [Acidimicrobiales bacterium]
MVHTRHVPGARWQPTVLDDADGLLRLLDNAIVARTQPERAPGLPGPGRLDGAGPRRPAGRCRPRRRPDPAGGRRPSRGAAPSLVAFTTHPGHGPGAARHLLMRMLLAARAASAPRASGRRRPVGLALAPLDGIAWSERYDLTSLEAETGVTVRDLADVVAAEPGAAWDRLDLVAPGPARPPGGTWVLAPAPAPPPDEPALRRLRWGTAATVEANCDLDARIGGRALDPDRRSGAPRA